MGRKETCCRTLWQVEKQTEACQMLSWRTKNWPYSINIWDTVTKVLPLFSVYQAPSYESNLTLLTWFLSDFAYLSMLFIRARNRFPFHNRLIRHSCWSVINYLPLLCPVKMNEYGRGGWEVAGHAEVEIMSSQTVSFSPKYLSRPVR